MELPKTLVAGTPENINDVRENLEALRDYVNDFALVVPDDSITTAKLLNANVTNAKLASPTTGVWRTILSVSGHIGDTNVTGINVCIQGTQVVIIAASSFGSLGATSIHLAAADFAVAGLSTMIQVKANILTNGTSIGAGDLLFGLVPVSSVGGAADTVAPSAGAQIGSEAQFLTAVATSSMLTDVGDEVAFPADGFYMPYCYINTANIAANARVLYSLQVRVRNA